MNAQGEENESAVATDGGSDPILAVRNLRKTYGDGEGAITAVDGVSFSISPGTIVGLLGHNGAGKTTTIKMILGLIDPSEGDIRIAGWDAEKHPRRRYDHVAAVLEGARNTYWRLTIRENLEFFARLGGYDPSEQREYHDRLLEKLDIADREDTVVNELSRGMKQKVSLATILARKPDILFLDEPTLGLDVESSFELRREIQRLVEQEEMTVVVSSHDMDVIEELCDRVIVLNDGEVVTDDDIGNLLKLFRSHEVNLVVEGGVSDEFKRSLESEYSVNSWTQQASRTRISLAVTDGEEMHRLLGRVLDAGLRIIDIETGQTDFEEIYLSITDEDDQNERQIAQ